MADDAGRSRPDLSKVAPGRIVEYDFFELLRRLEETGGRFGEAGTPDREPARLGQSARMAFAASDVAGFEPGEDGLPARVTTNVVGLLGPEGPMPIHLTRWVLDRLSQRWFAGDSRRETTDTTFLDFANLLQHRMIALYYRAWADGQPAVQAGRSGGGRIRAMLAALGGIGLPGTAAAGSERLDAIRLEQAPALAQQVEGPERLTAALAAVTGVPVRLVEFVGAWVPVPKALQTRLGMAGAALGRTATMGPRTFDRQNRVEIRLGPLTLNQYERFLPGGSERPVLMRAIRDLVGHGLDVDVRLVLRRDEVPPARLGAGRLGRTGWLAPAAAGPDAEEMVMRTFVGWRPEEAGP